MLAVLCRKVLDGLREGVPGDDQRLRLGGPGSLQDCSYISSVQHGGSLSGRPLPLLAHNLTSRVVVDGVGGLHWMCCIRLGE